MLGKHKKWVWIDKNNINEEMLTNDKKHPPQVMVWGDIGYNYRSQIIFLEKSVDQDYYIEKVIFESNFIDDTDKCWGIGNWVFQQDNAPAHKSQTTLAVLKELGINVLPNWPPYSPDLNIIEVVWAIMEARVEKANPNTIDELKDVIKDVWEHLSFATINGLVETMERRLKAVNENPGRTIIKLTKQ